MASVLRASWGLITYYISGNGKSRAAALLFVMYIHSYLNIPLFR